MAYTSHPSFQNHTHTYFKQSETTGVDIVDRDTLVMKTCPSGHTDCQADTWSTATALVLNEIGADNNTTTTTYWLTDDECTALGIYPTCTYDLGAHIHVMSWISVAGQALITNGTFGVCGLSHANCKKGTAYYIAKSGTSFYNTPSSYDGFSSLPAYENQSSLVSNWAAGHIHYYITVYSNTHAQSGFETCPSGHTDCKRTATAGHVSTTSGGELSTISNKETSGPTVTGPSVATNAANPVGNIYAVLNGTLTLGPCWCGFQIGTSSGNYNMATKWYYKAITGQSYACGVSGLSPSTTYYFRAIAQDPSGTYYGSELNFTTTGAPASYRSWTLIQQNWRGRPIWLARAKAIDTLYPDIIYEEGFTQNGIYTFTLLPTDRAVDVEVRWGKQFRKYNNVYEAAGDDIVTMVTLSHVQNTDVTVDGTRTSLPSSPGVGEVYCG